jgi:iron complex outermembrane receptor protein
MKPSLLPSWPRIIRAGLFLVAGAVGSALAAVDAARKSFDLPAASAEQALKRLAEQSGREVLFPADAVEGVRTRAVKGEMTPREALDALLAGTPLTGVQDARTGALTVRREPPAPPAKNVPSPVADSGSAAGPVATDAGRITTLDVFYVEGTRSERMVGGNLDLVRSIDDALPFTIFSRAELDRSGALDLEQFLQQNILQIDPSNGNNTFNDQLRGVTGNSNATISGLNLSSFSTGGGGGSAETVILVNGRRMANANGRNPPDVRTIPQSLIERIEVLPAGSGAIYGTGATGGAINIILRRDIQASELRLQYQNAFGFDAPAMSAHLIHKAGLLGGKLQVTLAATHSEETIANESELGYYRRAQDYEKANPAAYTQTGVNAGRPLTVPIGSTPNILRNSTVATAPGLFGLGTPIATSVAPGASGTGGLAAFAGREGVLNYALYPAKVLLGALAPFGLDSDRQNYTATFAYTPRPWLELSLDLGYSRSFYTTPALFANFTFTNLPATAANNPFGQAVNITFADASLWRTIGYRNAADSARTQGMAAVGTLLRLPRDWRLSVDATFSEAQTRSLSYSFNATTLQALAVQGAYNPFRDTLAFPAAEAVINQTGTYRIARPKQNQQQFTARLTNEALPTPTGRGQLVVGADYHRFDLNTSVAPTYLLDGTFSSQTVTLGQQQNTKAVFLEGVVPMLPRSWLPRFLTRADVNLAFRASQTDTYAKTNTTELAGLRLSLAGGFTMRASYGQSTREAGQSQIFYNDALTTTQTTITDPRRGNESYIVTTWNGNQGNPNLIPETGETFTYGLIWQMGRKHRIRVQSDYVINGKTNEISVVLPATFGSYEAIAPGLVTRQTAAPGDPFGVGRITFIDRKFYNLFQRETQRLTTGVSYSWQEAFGGVFTLSGNGNYLVKNRIRLASDSPWSDAMKNRGSALTTFNNMKYRANFNSNWQTRNFGAGVEAQYYHSLWVQSAYFARQGSDIIDRFWGFNAYTQADLTRWLPWKKLGLRGTLRVDNVLGADYPRDVQYDQEVRPYGNIRGRVYVVQVTTSF